MQTFRPTLVTLALIACGLLVPGDSVRAQSARVVPPGFDLVEGNALYTYPFGRDTGASQVLIDGALLGTGPSVVTVLKLRPNGDPTGSAYTGYTKTYRIEMTATPIVAASMINDPVANRGGAAPTVVYNGPVVVPSSMPATAPADFSIQIPLMTPFSFDPSQSNLLIEIRTADTAATPGRYALDAVTLRNDRAEGIVEQHTLGCTSPSGASVDMVVADTSLTVGGTFDLQVTSTPAGSFPIAIVFFGTTQLAFDLGRVGMPGCTLGVASDIFLTLSDTGSGFPQTTAPIANDPALLGAALVTQAFAQATPPSLTGSVTSPVYGLRLGNNGPHPVEMQSIFSPDFQRWFIGRVGTFAPVVRLEGTFQ